MEGGIDTALENVDVRVAGGRDFDAELRAQVGHGGGGSVNNEGIRD